MASSRFFGAYLAIQTTFDLQHEHGAGGLELLWEKE